MGQKAENSNLASEFFVMSVLCRMGLNPILTLGNRKEIDILLHSKNKTYTIDVKGIRDKTNWPIGNKSKIDAIKSLKNHLFIFVSFLNKFDDSTVGPEIYIVPSCDVMNLKVWWGAKYDQYSIMYNALKRKSKKYENAWHYLMNGEI
ncbi:MAG: hypothetical protein PHU86_04300 [Patescibacteria group bacterium]|nr:hypothetical protein [Patescibacteria group bacterium]